VQGLCQSRAIFATGPVVGHGETAKLLQSNGITPTPQHLPLRGIADKVAVFEIP
jgi:hypothetical protein